MNLINLAVFDSLFRKIKITADNTVIIDTWTLQGSCRKRIEWNRLVAMGFGAWMTINSFHSSGEVLNSSVSYAKLCAN